MPKHRHDTRTSRRKRRRGNGVPKLFDFALESVASSPMRAFKKWGSARELLNSKETAKKYQAMNNKVLSGAAVKEHLLVSVKNSQLLLDGCIPVDLFSPSMTHLDMANAQFSHVFFDQIFRRCPHIKDAILCGCYDFGDKCLKSLLEHTKGVEALHMSGCRRLTDTSMKLLPRKAVYLHTLDIGGCFNLSPAGVGSLASHPNRHKFVEIDISGTQFDQQLVVEIGNHFPALQTVGLGYCYVVSSSEYDDLDPEEPLAKLSPSCMYDHTLMQMLRNCRRLSEVRLHFCAGISSTIIQHLIVNLECLKRLDLCGAKGFSAMDIGQLIAARCPSGPAITLPAEDRDDSEVERGVFTLTYLNIKFCFAVTRKTQETWQQHYPQVNFIFDT